MDDTSMKITEAWFPSRVQQAASTRLCLAWPFLCLIWCCVCVVPNYSNYKLYQVTDYLKVINLQLTIESAYRVQGYLKYSHLTQPNSSCQQQPVLYTRAHCHCVSETNQSAKTITLSTGVQAADMYSVHGMVFGFVTKRSKIDTILYFVAHDWW